MSLIEQQLATELIELRHQESTGSLYTPIGDHINALQRHLDREQATRALIGALTDSLEAQ
jgi:hypothetical protein